jgi:hypothetical protein
MGDKKVMNKKANEEGSRARNVSRSTLSVHDGTASSFGVRGLILALPWKFINP